MNKIFEESCGMAREGVETNDIFLVILAGVSFIFFSVMSIALFPLWFPFWCIGKYLAINSPPKDPDGLPPVKNIPKPPPMKPPKIAKGGIDHGINQY